MGVTMRRLVFDGPHRLHVEEAAVPQPGADEVRIRVHSTGICGSDVHGYVGANDRRVPGMVMGHETCGYVDAVGADVDGIAIGDPVAVNPAVTCGECRYCRTPGTDQLCVQRRLYGCVLALPGAFADAVVVRARNVVALVGPAPIEWGVLAEPFAVGDHGAELLDELASGGVLVLGGGPIGIGAALAARRRGIDPVVVSEPVTHRREIATRLGLQTHDPGADAGSGAGETELSGFAGALECVAAPITLRTAVHAVRPAGRIVIVGMGALEIPLPVIPLVAGERVIRGSFNYTRESFQRVARWVMSGELDLSPVIESRVTLDQLPEAFASLADGSRPDLKTVYSGPGAAETVRAA